MSKSNTEGSGVLPPPPRPMLAAKGPSLEELWRGLREGEVRKYYLQSKIDGIRCLIKDGKAWSRSGKLIPNQALQKVVADPNWYYLEGLDGELLYKNSYKETVSLVMSRNEPLPSPFLADELTFVVFDEWKRTMEGVSYTETILELQGMVDRYEETRERCTQALLFAKHSLTSPVFDPYKLRLSFVDTFAVYCPEDISTCLSKKADWKHPSEEGYIIRSESSKYKHGRSTQKERYLLKYKNIEDSEALVVGTIPLERNLNKAEKDVFGYQVRSSKKDGKKEEETLGALICYWKGIQFKIGTGFTEEERYTLWKGGGCSLIGKKVKFTHLSIGSNGRPRFPVFVGWRDDTDLDLGEL